MKRLPLAAAVAAALLVPVSIFAFFALVRPYDVPEHCEVDSSESAFLIPLEGDSANQAALNSVKFLEEKKVAAKRVQVIHRWNQTGFLPSSGKWIPTVRVIKVDRRPITREWTRSTKSGTSARDEAVAAESMDSVNFSMGISCTAYIPEEEAAVFLYSYPSKSLADMMDLEIRARVQQVVAEESGRFSLFELPTKKNEIMKAVRAEVTPFFKKKGIDITTLGILGGLNFDNPEIQKAIDDAAKAAQLKVAAEAKRAAQEVENKTLLLAAEGKGVAAKREAQSKVEVEMVRVEGDGKVKKLAAEAEADAVRTMADAKAYEVQKIGEQPEVYLRLRSIETEALRWKLWDGRLPQTMLQASGSGGASTSVLLPAPALPLAGATAEKK